MDEYFQRYCGYTRTGGMGIGFYAAHTYEDRYAQRLAATQDAELKRLFVPLSSVRRG
jgi:hypothetical protein